MSAHAARGPGARHYAIFRALLGAWLTVHCVHLIPYAAEVWSNEGVLPDAGLSPLAALFPNVLSVFDTPGFVVALVGAAAGASAALALGVHDRSAAVFVWYVLTCLLGRNPLTANPALPFVGWLLLAHALAGPARAQRAGAGWHLPGPVFICAWLVMAAGYSYGGITKLASPSWLDGSALGHVLDNPLARPTALRTWLLAQPEIALRAATWSALALELLALPLAFSRRTRPALWLAMVTMHLSLVALVDFADLSTGMLLLHAYTFDPRWAASCKRAASRARPVANPPQAARCVRDDGTHIRCPQNEAPRRPERKAATPTHESRLASRPT